MKYKYVVIEREYGSGGTEIGKQLSKRLNVPCYGNEILEGVSAKIEIPVADIQQYEESATNSFLYSVYAFSKMNDSTDFLTRENQIFVEEQQLIKEYALQGPAVFVGRCAASALDDKDVLKVYIHADWESRKQRAMKDYEIPENMVDSTIAKYDKKRRSFYSVNTGKKWNDWNNYDLILDSGKLGVEACVQAIQAALD